jgi:hypothetical protein
MGHTSWRDGCVFCESQAIDARVEVQALADSVVARNATQASGASDADAEPDEPGMFSRGPKGPGKLAVVAGRAERSTQSSLTRRTAHNALSAAVAGKQDIKSDSDRIMMFLASYGAGERLGRFAFQGFELLEQLGIPAPRLQDACRHLQHRGLMKITEDGEFAPGLDFYEAALTSEGRYAAQQFVAAGGLNQPREGRDREDDEGMPGGFGDDGGFDDVTSPGAGFPSDVTDAAMKAELDAVHADLGDAVARVLVLEERVAHAEQARDNAIVQAEEAKASSKAKGLRAGEEIGRLKRGMEAETLRADKLAESVLALAKGLTPPESLLRWMKSVVGDGDFSVTWDEAKVLWPPWLAQFHIAEQPTVERHAFISKHGVSPVESVVESSKRNWNESDDRVVYATHARDLGREPGDAS